MSSSTNDDPPTTTNNPTLNLGGMECTVHRWNADITKPKAICVIYHGFLAHSQYPTVRYVAESLQSSSYAVIAIDLPGHGTSPGLRGYVPSAETLVKYGVSIARHALGLYGSNIPLFLVGSSLGGALALASSRHVDSARLMGVCLLAPMLALDVATPLRYLLDGLSYVVPTLQLIPSSATSGEKQYRCPNKRAECDGDNLSVSGAKIRVASAASCVNLANLTRASFSVVKCPFLCMVANEDVVVNNEGCFELMEQSSSLDKKMVRYDALHGLFCEPKPLFDKIEKDLIEWIDARVEKRAR